MTFRLRCLQGAVAAAAVVVSTHQLLAGPYVSDGNTIGLYHFDESSGAADPGNPFVNSGSGGTSLNFTNTGGPDGRDNSGGGGYGAATYSGFGTAFGALAAGDGTYHTGTSGSSTGGGAATAAGVTQTALQGADGAFTYEAIINLSANTTDEQTILAHDGSTTRGFLFRVTGGKLSLYDVNETVDATIPTTGPHAFNASKWYHVAVAYDGNAGVAGNTTFYWTAMDSGASQTNAIGTGTISADLTGTVSNPLGVGGTTRSPFRFETELVDEVRISSVARGPNDFLVPEPATVSLLGAGGMLLGLRRRRRA
jgi:hypothetical protein